MSRVTSETADRLKQSLAADQPVTMKLIVSSLADRLRDEHVLAELVQRSMAGENAFAALTREIVREEAEQIAQAALANAEPEAA
ncbi:hypothetical protein ASD92_25915 [Massilia sp. Root1485]|nr:hypothetical protein ASD92_25915 [Massilia sp. Root1485]